MSKLNPQTKSSSVGLANLDSQVCKSRLVRIHDTHCQGFVRIHWIHWIFWKLVGFMIHNTNQIRIHGPQTKTNLFKSRFVIRDTNQIWIRGPQTKTIFKSQDSWSTIQKESMDLQEESMGTQFPYMIPATLQIFNQLYGFRWSNILQSDLFPLTFCPTHNSKKNSHSIITAWSVVYHRILHKTIDTKNYVLRVCNCSELSCQKCLNHLTKYFCANHHPMALQKQSNQSYIGIILH